VPRKGLSKARAELNFLGLFMLGGCRREVLQFHALQIG
jgi:hypothetical protein